MATETIIDEICEQLELDPIEFRSRNASREGTRRIDGPVFSRIGMAETVAAIRDSEHWHAPLSGPYRGRGVASGFWFNAGLQSSATATVNADGRVSLVEGSTDIGGSRTGIAMQLAETLGISAEDVTPTVADTDGVGYTDVTGGSRVTYATGWAAYEAGQDIRRQLIERAALLWDVDPSAITYEDDGLIRGPGERRITFQELAAKLSTTGGPVIGRGTSTNNRPGGAFATHLVDVEVDPETGKVTILRYTAAQDVGTAIHPAYVEGQVQGGVVQGIGWALNEEYVYDAQGRMRNASFLDYRMPTCYDVPLIEPILVEVPNPGHPYRRSRSGRGADRSAAGRDRQRHLPRHRSTHASTSHVAAARAARDPGTREAIGPLKSAMPRIFIPPQLRAMTAGAESVDVSGKNVREAIEALSMPNFPASPAISVTATRSAATLPSSSTPT